MPHPYDASTKYLVQTRPADWLALCGRTTTSPVEIVDSDLSAVTSAADRVLRILDDPAWLLHLELQASRDLNLLTNLLLYNTLLERRHGLLVRTVVVLLRPSADFPEMTGVLQRQFPGESPYQVSLPILEGAVEKGFAHCHQHKRGAMLSRDGSETTSRPNSAKA